MPLSKKEIESLFILAGFTVLKIEALINQYGTYGDPVCPDYFTQPMREPWWFVKTSAGWIKFGKRKKVFSIEWDDCEFRGVISEDDVTKEDCYIHAWSIEKALEYLTKLCDLSKEEIRSTRRGNALNVLGTAYEESKEDE